VLFQRRWSGPEIVCVGRVQNQPEIGGQVFRVDRKVGAARLRVGKVGVNKF